MISTNWYRIYCSFIVTTVFTWGWSVVNRWNGVPLSSEIW